MPAPHLPIVDFLDADAPRALRRMATSTC